MTPKANIRTLMEKIIGEDAVDKEKISFLKGYKEGMREICQPSWIELRSLIDKLESQYKEQLKSSLEKILKERKDNIKRLNNDVDDLIKEVESK